MSEPVPIPALLARWRRRGLACFVGFGLLAALGAWLDPDRFLQAWLLAFLFWLAFPLGAFAVVQIHHMTGGAWGLPVRRLLEAAARTIPLLALLFVPIALSLDRLYVWADPEVVAHDALLQHKQPYLNVPFFLARAALYFLIWFAASRVQDRLSARRDRVPDQRLLHKQRTIAAPALALYALAMTFAAFDWSMSLEPHWFSSIYGIGFLVGQGLTAFALGIVVATVLARRESIGRWVSPDHFHDLGKLMFAFVLLWAYVSYSQFLLIWMGNLLEEIPWYVARMHGGWGALALAIIALHFALPFLILLSRAVKRRPGALFAIAAGLLVMRWLDLAWNVLPAFHPEGFALHWLDPVVTLALGGLWLATFARQLAGRPLISLQDGGLQEAFGQVPSTTS